MCPQPVHQPTHHHRRIRRQHHGAQQDSHHNDTEPHHLPPRRATQRLAIDSLYRFTAGHSTLAPIDGHTVTALHTTHPWGYSAQLHATDSHGNLHAAAEATATHPLPTAIRSRIRTFRSGPLAWHNAAARITDDACPDPADRTVFVASGHHHYELSRRLDPANLREYWDLRIDGHRQEPAFAGPTGAAEFVTDTAEAGR
ncbi:hypothetical protein [Mycobacterium simiae]|uniref:hypothetical protein n=1 Tax=Mycobacterium simiae TaxID=1784 RepID=UPI0026129077|nr:hypothetical protein [Mycobacterium simiae]